MLENLCPVSVFQSKWDNEKTITNTNDNWKIVRN